MIMIIKNNKFVRLIYHYLSRSVQSATGLETLKLAASGRYCVGKFSTLLITFIVQKCIYLSVIIGIKMCKFCKYR